jgi:hypothetical protein
MVCCDLLLNYSRLERQRENLCRFVSGKLPQEIEKRKREREREKTG